jgi:hypothetical protein
LDLIPMLPAPDTSDTAWILLHHAQSKMSAVVPSGEIYLDFSSCLAGGLAPRKGRDEVANVAGRSLADAPTQTLALDRDREFALARQIQERL